MAHANAATTLHLKENYAMASVSVEELYYYNF